MADLLAKDVMIRQVYTIHPKRKIALARLRMFRQGVAALPVVDDDNILIGMINLRDTDLAGTYDLIVEDLMTIDLITVNEDTPIVEVAKVMLKTGSDHIPVLRDGELSGLITPRGVIRALIEIVLMNRQKKSVALKNSNYHFKH